MNRELDRRTVLKLVAALSLSPGAAPLFAGQEADVLDGLGEVEAAAIRDLAKAYAEDQDDASGVREMAERLRGTSFADDELIAALREEMRADYEAGRLASLYGWQVSRTEGRVVSAAAELLG